MESITLNPFDVSTFSKNFMCVAFLPERGTPTTQYVTHWLSTLMFDVVFCI